MVTESKAMFGYLSAAACPFPYPKGFPSPQGERLRPRIGSPKPDAGPLTLAAHWLTLLPSKSARAAPASSRALTAVVDRSPTAELSDELKKLLQALREAGRARWIFGPRSSASTSSPISGCNVSQLVTLCLSSPVRNHGSKVASGDAAGSSFPSESAAGATLFVLRARDSRKERSCKI